MATPKTIFQSLQNIKNQQNLKNIQMARASFTATFEDGESRTIYANSVSIKNGFWLNEKDEKLVQTNGITSEALFGNKVKIQIITDDAKDGRKINIEIKAKIGNEYIQFTDNEEELKHSLIVKNDEGISEPIYLNPKWYDEAIEQYNFENHQTEIDTEKVLTFVFDAKFESQKWEHSKKNLPKEDTDKLVPFSYRRNYEELIGLFNTDNSGEKDKETNYENKFINSNPNIQSIVDKFIEKVIKKEVTISEIKILVEEKATELWDASVQQVQNGDLDDRPLYWARNKMQTWLKRNPIFQDQIDFDKSIIKKGTELDEIITLFEEKSRNYTGIDFSKAGSQKKILITGFDPFLLNSIDHMYKDSFNILQSNPSGCVALNLNKNDKLGAYIQTMIIPVRYADFDSSKNPEEGNGIGIIEKYIAPFVSDVNIIITVSQSGPGDYNVDKFATARRGGFNDNLDFIREKGTLALNISDEWIETTLPKEMTNTPYVKYNWDFNRVSNVQKEKPLENQILNQGSGGDYLSNEIFYRVAKLRKDNKPTLPTGHFHISKIQLVGQDLDKSEVNNLLKIVNDGIKEGIKGI